MTAPNLGLLLGALSDQSNFGNRPDDGPLRPGGVLSSSINPASEENLPDTPSECVKRQQPGLAIMRDVLSGTPTMRAEGQTYLPKEPGEDPANYGIRLKRSVFFNVTSHTVEGLVGQVFRRDPKLGDDVPPVIAGTDTQPGHVENIDNAGTHFDIFARDVFHDALAAGHSAILVDFPNTGGQQRHSSEIKQEVRPYWVPIKKDDILSWRTTTENGKLILTQLVLKECRMVPDGMFGELEQTLYRVFVRTPQGQVGFVLLQINKDKSVTVVDAGTYPTQTEIPVAEIRTSGSTGLFESDPPLLDLAYMNIAQYQMWSDYVINIHKTCVPIYVESGVMDTGEDGQPTPIVIGPNTARRFTSENAKAYYVSHTGQALAAIKEALDDLKSDMGTLGLAMLSPQKRTAETAQAKRLDKSTEDSALAVAARGLQDGLERALYFHAKYLKLPDGGSVQINKQFDAQTMGADMLTAWTSAVANAGIPERLMLRAMQIGELIDPDEQVDDIADEMAANKAAAQDQQLAEMQAKADAMQNGQQPPKGGAQNIAA